MMLTDLSLVLALIVLNGVFAMSEIAVVSSKKARLQRLASEGRRGAAKAIELAADPTRFLSTVQVGIECSSPSRATAECQASIRHERAAPRSVCSG